MDVRFIANKKNPDSNNNNSAKGRSGGGGRWLEPDTAKAPAETWLRKVEAR